MKSKILLLGAMGAAAIVAAGCHHDNNGSSTTTTTTTTPPTTPPPTTSSAMDTAQVLALAQTTSESGSPFAVNGGAFSFSDTSDSSAPISVTQ